MSGTWSSQNVILFARTGTGILRVDAGGGEPQAVTTINSAAGETIHSWPAFLPDGRHFIYLKVVGAVTTQTARENSQLMWRALDSPDEHVVRKLYSKPFYSPTGHLVFRLDGPIVAQPFDASTGTVSGDPVQLVGDTWANGSQTALALSPSGVLAHRAGERSTVAQLTWFDRDGKLLATVGTAADYRNPFVDLAGERVVANTRNPADVWLLDSRRGGITQKITFDPANDTDPIFSPDGKWIAFYSARQPAGIYRSNGTGTDELVLGVDTTDISVTSVARDGSLMILQEGTSNQNIWTFNTASGKPEPLLSQPYPEQRGAISPDGKFLAYQSAETGGAEIYIRELKPNGGKWQVSTDAGRCPLWRADGKELYFVTLKFDFMAVPISTEKELEIGAPVKLFNRRFAFTGANSLNPYAVSNNGQRFFILAPAEEEVAAEFIVVENWPEELKK